MECCTPSISPVPLDRSLSHEVPPLRPFFEKIIDKKINNIALNVFERIVDTLCSYFYASYRKRLDYLIDLNFGDKGGDDLSLQTPAKTVAEKVLRFMDGAPLYDRTSTGRVNIQRAEWFDIITQKRILGEDQIIIDGKPVYFDPSPKIKLLFGKIFGTKEVFVTDVKECPEMVFIYEREISNQLKVWCVDTTQPTQKILMGGQIPLSQTDVFLAQQIAPQAAPAPLMDTFP